MSNPLMEKMLDLPEFEVTDFKQNDNDMGFYVQTKNHSTGYMTVLLAVKPKKRFGNGNAVFQQTTQTLMVGGCWHLP